MRCLNCRREIEFFRVAVLSSCMCSACAKKFDARKAVIADTGLVTLKSPKPKISRSSKLVVSISRDGDPFRVCVPFKRVNRPTVEIIRDGYTHTEFVPISCLVNRVVDNNVASSNDLSDASSEFDTGISWCPNRNS